MDEDQDQREHEHEQEQESMPEQEGSGVLQSRRSHCSHICCSGWFKKLFTINDPHHIHALLGGACFLHIAYRFACIPWSLHANSWYWATPNLMNFSSSLSASSAPSSFGDTSILWWLLLHVSLSASSFVFELPWMRHKQGTRIWPQFRAQQAVFVLRAAVNVLLVHAYQAKRGSARSLLGFLGFPIPTLSMATTSVVFASLLGIDAVDSLFPADQRSPTVRGASTKDASKTFASFMQFLATARALFGLQSFDGYFLGLALLQLTSFFMTLQRKGLMSHAVTLALYAVLLVLLLAVYIQEVVRELGFVGLVCLVVLATSAMMLRTRTSASKYTIWASIALGTQAVLPLLKQ